MKKLIFIDNDSNEQSSQDMNTVKRRLRNKGGLNSEYLETMEAVTDFTRVEKNDAFKILFNPANCIVTYSMYTFTHYNSLSQLKGFLATAGRNNVKGITFIDGSGQVQEALERIIEDSFKNNISILNAIETNNIITYDMDDDTDFMRLRVEFKGCRESCFKLEPFSLVDSLKI